MSNTKYSIEALTSLVSVGLGVTYTDEQLQFIYNLNAPMICFASPGTGKTASAVAGLLLAESYHEIPGDNIYALSFTRMATGELRVRHDQACRKMGMKQTVHFQTLHKLCRQILKENISYLGCEKLSDGDGMTMEERCNMLLECAKDNQIKLSPYKVWSTAMAISNLNSSLVFDEAHVSSKKCFKDTGLSIEDFTLLRHLMYQYSILAENIQVSDIMIYTLELLLKNPEVMKKVRTKIQLMLVDEAQDLSLLQLSIIGMLSDNAILIGDMKQQIYAFNGACQEIVEQYYKLFPNARTVEFNQSFRCADAIAAFATPIILPNEVGGKDFKGAMPGGKVIIEDKIDVPGVCCRIRDEFVNNGHIFPRGLLFLARTNYSLVPLIDQFYKLGVPVQVNDYEPVNRMPMLKELCEIIDLAGSPRDCSKVGALKYLIPEFAYYKYLPDNPIYQIMVNNGIGLFQIQYHFENEFVGNRAMSLLLDVQEMLGRGAAMTEIINKLWPMFCESYANKKARSLEQKPLYYVRQAEPILRDSNFNQVISNEANKVKTINDSNNRRLGVRCYTFHAAKGLEDDIVYIIDADASIIPNDKKLNELVQADCAVEVAREIRNERALCYVAVTRARHEVHIQYNTELAAILRTPLTDNKVRGMRDDGLIEFDDNLTPEYESDTYASYDRLYKRFKADYNDREAFLQFTEEE